MIINISLIFFVLTNTTCCYKQDECSSTLKVKMSQTWNPAGHKALYREAQVMGIHHNIILSSCSALQVF